MAHGLLQHETKLSVLNFAVKKDSNFTETLPNKAELLFVTGLRSARSSIQHERQIHDSDDRSDILQVLLASAMLHCIACLSDKANLQMLQSKR